LTALTSAKPFIRLKRFFLPMYPEETVSSRNTINGFYLLVDHNQHIVLDHQLNWMISCHVCAFFKMGLVVEGCSGKTKNKKYM